MYIKDDKFGSELSHTVVCQLRERRKYNGLNQSELAELIGVQTRDVSHFERGIHPARLETIEQYASALGYETVIKFTKLAKGPLGVPSR